MASRGLADLPTELIVLILSGLDHEHLARSRRVSFQIPSERPCAQQYRSVQLCKRLRATIDETPLLQYIIESEAAGYGRPQAEGSVRESFDKFRRNQRSYRSPRVKALGTLLVNVEGTCPDLLRKTWYPSWQLCSTYLLGISFDAKSVGVLSLLPQTSPAHRYRDLDLPFSIGALQVDLSQDLLVLQDNTKLYVRSFANGHVHPRFHSEIDYILLPSCTLVQGSDHIYVWEDWILVSGYRVLGRVWSWTTSLLHWPSGRTAKVRAIAPLVFPLLSCLRGRAGLVLSRGYTPRVYRAGTHPNSSTKGPPAALHRSIHSSRLRRERGAPHGGFLRTSWRCQ